MPRFERIHVHLPMLIPFANHPVEQRLDGREFVILQDDEQLIAALPEMEILMAFRPPPGHWAKAEKLQFVQVPGAGVDSLISQPDLHPDVVVCNASGSHEPEMSEFVITMLHATTYRVLQLIDQQRERFWRSQLIPGHALDGGKLCILGLGTIGANVARRASALGMDVVGVRHSGRPVDHVRSVVTPDRRLEVLDGATALVVITPLTDDTRGLVGAEELAALAPGAVVVDVSRGGVVEIDALVAALDSGHVFGAAVDVFETEPLPIESPLWNIPNLIITPHTAGASADYTRRISDMFANNLEAFERGEVPPGQVSRVRGY